MADEKTVSEEAKVEADQAPVEKNVDIEYAYPESYTETEMSIANSVCDYMNLAMGNYTRAEITGIIKFVADFFGVVVDFGRGDHAGWFPITKDIAYDLYAQEHSKEE